MGDVMVDLLSQGWGGIGGSAVDVLREWMRLGAETRIVAVGPIEDLVESKYDSGQGPSSKLRSRTFEPLGSWWSAV